jgi:AI-2 transport protein TqsA
LLKKLGLRQWSDVDPLSLMSATNVGSMLLGTTNAVVGLLSDSVLVMIFLAFLLLGEPMASVGFWGEVQSQIKVYLVAKVVLSTATGFLVGIVLWSLGVDLALVFGLFTFLLNFIPNVGPIIATLLPLPVVLVSPDVSATSAVLAIALPLVIHQIFGNIVEPRMMGTSLDLDPIAILLALIFWGTLWGVVGMLLATPITGVLRILLQRLDITAPLGDVLAGRR